MRFKNYNKGMPVLIAGWGFNAGVLYGSFFSKLTASEKNFNSNFESGLPATHIGFAFFTAVIALI